jgi:hypothetical protein
MRYLLCLLLGLSFVGANCGSANPIVRTCQGSPAQSASFIAEGSCGNTGVITITVGSADSCTLALSEPTDVGLPIAGTFNNLSGATGYVLTRGNWNLQNVTNGTLGDNSGPSCTAGAADANGAITLGCTIIACSTVGEDPEPTCAPSGTCTMHLTPASADASVPGAADAGVTHDASTGG